MNAPPPPTQHLDSFSAFVLVSVLLSACGSSDGATAVDPDGAVSDAAADASSSVTTDGAPEAGDTEGGLEAGLDATTEAPPDPPDGANPDSDASETSDPVPDPEIEGPYEYESEDLFHGLSPVHCEVPVSGPASPPHPLVLFAHGFLIEPFRYYAYLEHLASFGYVACTVAYSSFGSQEDDPEAIIDVLDWALEKNADQGASLFGKIDPQRLGVMGHSRGGKAAVHAAARDARFQAVFALDPVNTCPMGTCPDALAALPSLSVPTGFLGETTDDGSAGESQPCAPAPDNFQQFFAAANSPSLSVEVLGANHMSFVVSDTGCLQCSVCQDAPLERDVVLKIAYAYSVAFFERHLRDQAGYDAHLTGSIAQQRYAQTGLAKITAK